MHLDSAEARDIENYLKVELGAVPFKLEVGPADKTYVVLVDEWYVSDRVSSHSTSRARLGILREAARRRFKVDLEFAIRRSDQTDAIEGALHVMFSTRLPGVVSSLHLSTAKAGAFQVWVELAASGAVELADRTKEFKAALSEFAETFKIKIDQVRVLGKETKGHPSPLAILREVKLAAPASAQEIQSKLVGAGYDADDAWLGTQLDGLRRHGLISWARFTRKYALTFSGLSALPTSRSRESSDVGRVLALAKRKW